MSNFKETTGEGHKEKGGERHIRHVTENCWISVLYRLTGFGHYEWETAICFQNPPADPNKPSWRDRDILIIGGDRRKELNDMPKEKLRGWYEENINGNRNTMETLIEALRENPK